MAKKGIHHSDYHPVTIILPNGSEVKTMSTYKGNQIFADIDIFNHPAWKSKDDDRQVASVNAVVSKFEKRFQNKRS